VTSDKLKAIMETTGMSTSDLARITGRSIRSIELYRAGSQDVPRWLALIMDAISDGTIGWKWLAVWVHKAN
jgi:predicted transcriptional regulator